MSKPVAAEHDVSINDNTTENYSELVRTSILAAQGKATVETIDLSGNSIEGEGEDEGEDYEEFICEYCDKEFTTTKECDHHERKCKANVIEKDSVKKTPAKQKTGCSLCGAVGHLTPDCHLTRHVD